MVAVGCVGTDSTTIDEQARVQIFNLASADPVRPVFILPNPTGNPYPSFSSSLALHGSIVVAWDRFSSSAYVYDLSGTYPTEPVHVLKIDRPWWQNSNSVVAIYGSFVAVAVRPDDRDGAQELARVYDLKNAQPETPVYILAGSVEAREEPEVGIGISERWITIGGCVMSGDGVVHVYDYKGDNPESPAFTLQPERPNSTFGWRVSVTGDWVAVSGNSPDATNTVSLFNLAEASPTVPVRIISAAESGLQGKFGSAMSAGGDRLVVASANEKDRFGKMASYGLAPVGDSVPLAVMRTMSTGFDNFGHSISVSGIRAAVGCGSPFARYVYVFDLASAKLDVPLTILESPRPGDPANFGGAVALDGDYLLVGASKGGGSEREPAGRALLYDLRSSKPLAPSLELRSPSGVDDYFGSAVAMAYPYVVVGAPGGHQASMGGKAFVFNVQSANPDTPFLTLENLGAHSSDNFGAAVSISRQTIAVGVPGRQIGATTAGEVAVYRLDSETPAIPIFVLSRPCSDGAPAVTGAFGSAVAAAGSLVAVGDPADVQSNSGAAYLYDGASLMQRLLNPTPKYDDRFGNSVALRESVGAVGVPRRGRAYGYAIGADSAQITNVSDLPVGHGYEQFGTAVAISGTEILVGASEDNSAGARRGAVYVIPFTAPKTRAD